MNTIKRRTMIILALAALVVLSLSVFLYRYVEDGAEWAGAYFNSHAWHEGVFVAGQVQDRNGVELLYTRDGQRAYHESEILRRATLHAVGDAAGNIGGSAQNQFKKELMGYTMLNGLWALSGDGRRLRLTIDADLNAIAYEALSGRSGCVMVYDYVSGEILCMVSSPGFDPANPPKAEDSSGAYINRCLTASFPPGSIFKLVTLAAALEQIPGLETRTFTCDGSYEINGDAVTCTDSHGEQDLRAALANSCNSAFAELSLELGAETIRDYAEKAGLLHSLEIDNYTAAAGSFDLAEQDIDLAWSGIGQYHDMVTPVSMLRYVGAIANGGQGVTPRLLKSVATSRSIPLRIDLFHSSERLLSSATAQQLKEMMINNVQAKYGAENFPGLNIGAKSGTAEVEGQTPHAWFTGFLDDPAHPYAFIVLVENGGAGLTVAGSVANRVLQAAVAK